MGSLDTIRRVQKGCQYVVGVVLILVSALNSYGQKLSADSLSAKIDSLQALESAKSAWLRNKADSIKSLRFTRADSTEAAITNRIDSVTRKLNHSIDSLNDLKMPGEQYLFKVDSLFKNYRQRLQTEVGNRSDSLGVKTKQKLDKIDSVYASRTRVIDSILVASTGKSINIDNNLKEVVPDLKLPVDNKSLNLNIDSPLKMDRVSAPDINNPISNKPDIGLPNVNGFEKLNDIKNVADEVKNLSKETTELAEEAKKIKEGDHSARLEQEIGNQAKRIDEVSELSKQSKAVDQLKDQVEATQELSNPEALEKKAKKKFVDHFAGKEEMLKKDMDDIGKLQMKYRDIPDARNLPKRKPNEMKDKPFLERLVPAINFQVFNAKEVTADIAPYIGYKISGRIQAGVSMYKRVKILNTESVFKGEELFGFRASQNFRFAKGMYTHLEFDRFEDRITQNRPVGQGYTSSFGWNSKINFGLYRTYSLGKGFKGSMVLLYDIMNIKKFPQSSHSAFRFGFEYSIKKRVKKNGSD